MPDDRVLNPHPLGPAARIGYVFMETRDLARALAFYVETLGFETVFVQRETCAFLRLGGGGPQLAIYRAVSARTAGAHPLLAIDVPDLDGALAALGRLGVEPREVTEVPGGRAAILEDPDGNLLEIHEPERRR